MTDRTVPLAICHVTIRAIPRALTARGIDAAPPWFRLPRPMRTLTPTFLAETEEKLAQGFLTDADTLPARGTSGSVRIALAAGFLDNPTIVGRHIAHKPRNAIDVVPHCENRMIRNLTDGLWRVAESDHDMAKSRSSVHRVTGAARTGQAQG